MAHATRPRKLREHQARPLRYVATPGHHIASSGRNAAARTEMDSNCVA